eukprot:SAG22_NODE_289_length_12942_cov_6.674531_7_plen_78_part_00
MVVRPHQLVRWCCADESRGIRQELEIFVDGAICEIYFNGEVLTLLAEHATNGKVALTVEQGKALVTLDAWKMADSIE